jgi:hypothetical protein
MPRWPITENPATSVIRVALRVTDGPSPAYLTAAAEAVVGVAGAEVVLILAAAPVLEPTSARRRLLGGIEATYDWLERWALRGGPAALVSRGPIPLPTGVPVVRRAPVEAQIDALRAARADVLIDLAPEDGAPPPPSPPAGRWHLRYAVGVDGARRPGLTRPAASAGLAESLLSIELGEGPALETEVGVSALRRIGYSRDRDAVYWRSSLLPARRLARLVAGEAVRSAVGDAPALPHVKWTSSARRAWAGPPFVELATTVVGKVLGRVLFRTGWLVLVRSREPGQGPPRDLSGFRPIEAPKGRFYADPFVVDTGGGPRLYVEDCPDGAHRGRISTLRKAADGRWTLERVVLDDMEHRAYPHVLRAGTGLLVSPDSGRGGGVDLFVDHWPAAGLERIGRCLEGVPASDPTLLWHDGRYWLFVTVTGHGMSPWDELHLYSAATLAGVWHPHPRNPIVADVRRARPAGRIFRRGDEWIRPGQDCSVAYGRRIVLSAINTLTPDAYAEHPISSIEPDGFPGVRRTHTYTFDGSIEALDGYRRVFRRPRGGQPSQ